MDGTGATSSSGFRPTVSRKRSLVYPPRQRIPLLVPVHCQFCPFDNSACKSYRKSQENYSSHRGCSGSSDLRVSKLQYIPSVVHVNHVLGHNKRTWIFYQICLSTSLWLEGNAVPCAKASPSSETKDRCIIPFSFFVHFACTQVCSIPCFVKKKKLSTENLHLNCAHFICILLLKFAFCMLFKAFCYKIYIYL